MYLCLFDSARVFFEYLNGSENYEVTAFDDLDEAKADFKHFTYPVIVLQSTLMYFKTGM